MAIMKMGENVSDRDAPGGASRRPPLTVPYRSVEYDIFSRVRSKLRATGEIIETPEIIRRALPKTDHRASPSGISTSVAYGVVSLSYSFRVQKGRKYVPCKGGATFYQFPTY